MMFRQADTGLRMFRQADTGLMMFRQADTGLESVLYQPVLHQ